MGVACDVIAPSLIPKGSSDRVKTDKRDSVRLALTHRAGLLTAIRVPSPAEEAVRDLVRARGDLLDDRKRMQQRLNAMLLRHGRIWRGGAKWSFAHRVWVDRQVFDEPALAEALALYRGGLEAREAELAAAGARLAAWAGREPLVGPVARLGGYRGIAQLTGLTLAAEVVDWRRFASARAFMGFAGLIPTEYSSGSRTRRGHITKAGPGRGPHRLDRGGVGLPAPARHRGRAQAAAGRPAAGDAGPLVEGAAAAARQVQEDDRPRQAVRGRRHRGGPRAGRLRVDGDDHLTTLPGAGAAAPALASWRCTGTHAAAGMIPVNVLSEPALAVSVGHRPANSRRAVPIREYEPGSGESHDPAPVRRLHLPRSPPAACRPRRAGQDRRPPLRPQGCFASRFARRPAAAPDPGASAAAVAGKAGRPRPAPPHGAPPPGSPVRPPLTSDTAGASPPRPAGHQKKRSSGYKQDKRSPGREQRLDRPFHMNIQV